MKIKRDKDLCSKLPRYMDFLHRFRVGASSFYVKKYPSWNTYNCKGKFCLLVYTSSFVKTSITHLSINFTACFHSLYFKNFKKNVPFFFFYLPCQINKRTLSVQKNYFCRESFINKAIQFSRSFVLWQVLLIVTGSLLKFIKLFPSRKLGKRFSLKYLSCCEKLQ